MTQPKLRSVRSRRAASIWTRIHPVFALGQLLAFLVSLGLLTGYFFGEVGFHNVHVSVLVKVGLMLGAIVTGALWEHDVYGAWWFATEFLVEDTMTLIVVAFHALYLFLAYTQASHQALLVGVLCIAYGTYIANVAQYIHRTQADKKKANRELGIAS